jgi:hypothetical protein
MNPDVVDGLGSLRERRIVSSDQAASLLRVARGELVSVRTELSTFLYAGVLLVTAGIGIFLKENHDRLGPAVITGLLGAAAAACLVYAFRRSRPFSWQSTPSDHIAADYVLLLGVLLLASDLAYVETQFRLLGPSWTYHLLLVAALSLAAAYRFDSRAVLSLALTSFAAWRGVAVTVPFAGRSGESLPAVRANALACGALFVAAGVLSVRAGRKPHFEPVWITLGLILVFGGALSGVFGDRWIPWEGLLFFLAAAVVAVSYRYRRSLYFAIGVIAAYVGLLRILGELLEGRVLLLVVAASSLAVITLLVRSHRRMKDAP